MSKNFNKIIFILLALIFLISISQACFAEDIQIYDSSNNTIQLNHYYFDSNAADDGDGSAQNPYKYLRDGRIRDNSAIHLANGEYDFTPINTRKNVCIIGEDSNQTIISGTGSAFKVKTNFLIRNITLVNTQIYNQGKLNASGVIFKNAVAHDTSSSYGNSIEGQSTVPRAVMMFIWTIASSRTTKRITAVQSMSAEEYWRLEIPYSSTTPHSITVVQWHASQALKGQGSKSKIRPS